MDWEPGYVTMYLDGVPVWTDTNPAAIPQWNMHLCVQLDAMNAGVLDPAGPHVRRLRSRLPVAAWVSLAACPSGELT